MGNVTIKRVLSLANQEEHLRRYKSKLESLLGDVNQGDWVQYAKVKGIQFDSQYTGNVSIDPHHEDEQELQEFMYDLIHTLTQQALQYVTKQHQLVQEELESIETWLAYK